MKTLFRQLEGGALRRLTRARNARPSTIHHSPSIIQLAPLQPSAFRLPPSRRVGFSLLELLMAITVLIIIVLVIALVFQQANTAWGSGTRKAGAETTLRAIMGIVERDLTHAVDATQFGQVNDFSTASFVTLDGTNRMPQLVQYKYKTSDGSLERTTYSLIADASPATTWQPGGTPTSDAFLNGNQPLSLFTLTVVPAPATATTPGLPLRVEIEAHVQKQGAFAVVSGYSLGRGRGPTDMIVANP